MTIAPELRAIGAQNQTPQALLILPGLRLSETAEDTSRLAASSPVRAESPQKDGVGGARFVFSREG